MMRVYNLRGIDKKRHTKDGGRESIREWLQSIKEGKLFQSICISTCDTLIVAVFHRSDYNKVSNFLQNIENNAEVKFALLILIEADVNTMTDPFRLSKTTRDYMTMTNSKVEKKTRKK